MSFVIEAISSTKFLFNICLSILILGKLFPVEFSLNVDLASFSASEDSFLPCSIAVVLFASKIFRSLMLFFLIFSTSLIEISVNIFKNLITSLSSVFLQNCQ